DCSAPRHALTTRSRAQMLGPGTLVGVSVASAAPGRSLDSIREGLPGRIRERPLRARDLEIERTPSIPQPDARFHPLPFPGALHAAGSTVPRALPRAAPGDRLASRHCWRPPAPDEDR